MEKSNPTVNIGSGESVNPELEQEVARIESDPAAILRLVDLLFFLDDRPAIPS